MKKHGLTPILSSFQELKVGVTLDGAKLSKFCSFIMDSIKLLDCRMVNPLKEGKNKFGENRNENVQSWAHCYPFQLVVTSDSRDTYE